MIDLCILNMIWLMQDQILMDEIEELSRKVSLETKDYWFSLFSIK